MTNIMQKNGIEVRKKTLSLEVIETPSIEYPEVRRIHGKTKFCIKDCIEKAATQTGVKLFILNEKNKYVGKINIFNFTARRYYTFFDLVFKNQLNLVPIVAVDFSMANLKMDDASVLHTLKPGVQNDYVEALKGIHEAFAPFSNFKLAYGYGARTH